MKAGTPDHPKIIHLSNLLDIPRYAAVGILETLWHWTAKYAIAGNIGRYDDDMIAHAIGWQGDAAELVSALVESQWLDKNDEHRLIVHDWPDHCEDSVHMKLARRFELFADGTMPRLNRFNKSERTQIETQYSNAHGAHTARTQQAHETRTALAEANALAEAEAEAMPLPIPKPKPKGAREHMPQPEPDQAPDPDPRPDSPSVSEIKNLNPSDSGSTSTSGDLGGPGQSTGITPDARERPVAALRFHQAVEPLFGRNGVRQGRSPPGQPQYQADETCARQWFDEWIWPQGDDPVQCRARVKEAMSIVDRVKKRTGLNTPMAYLTGEMKKAFDP